MKSSLHYRDGQFLNQLPNDNPIDGTGMLGAALQYAFASKGVTEPEAPPKVVALDSSSLQQAPPDGLRVTWLGHSTTLIEIDGYRVLTDPVWSDRVSPFGFAGPSRFFEPPLALEDLPEIDAVLISHDHYDHLDYETILALEPTACTFVVPLGVGAHLQHWGVAPSRIIELDWWDEIRVGELKLVSVPARHYSGRSLFEHDATLWSSWVVDSGLHRVYFSGDTGFHPAFAEIGERYGPFDITLIESGAYSAMWRDSHLGPEQAVRAHVDLRGKLLVPIHWGTFDLAMHTWTEPAERILAEARRVGVTIAIPRPGRSVHPGQLLVARWWPSDLPWESVEAAPVVSSCFDARDVRAQPLEPNVSDELRVARGDPDGEGGSRQAALKPRSGD